MKLELEQELTKKFPLLYQYVTEITKPLIPMAFGFEFGDGWFNIISNLSERIEEYNRTVTNPDLLVKAFQVKEKYGGLRFYIGGAPNEIHDLIEKTEDESLSTCEDCGSPGDMAVSGGWYKTLCDSCMLKLNYNRLLPKEL